MVFAASASATNFGPFSCTTCGNGFDASAFNQDMDGQLIVASVSGLAETHDQYYDGALPSLGTTETATPEPTTFLLFGSALMAMTVLMRRRMD